MASNEELAYVAGFIDGEGSIGIISNGKNHITAKLQIANTNITILKWINALFGNIGYIGEVVRKNKKHKNVYILGIKGKQLKTILNQLLPFLRLKKNQAELVCGYIDFSLDTSLYKTMLRKKIVKMYRDEITTLNRKGT